MRLSKRDKIKYIMYRLLTDDHAQLSMLWDRDEDAIEIMEEVHSGLTALLIVLGVEIDAVRKRGMN